MSGRIIKRLVLKIDEILNDLTNYKPPRNELKDLERVHVRSFVIIF